MVAHHLAIAYSKNIIFFPGIEDLREKREELNRSILRDEEEKAKIQKVWNRTQLYILLLN